MLKRQALSGDVSPLPVRPGAPMRESPALAPTASPSPVLHEAPTRSGADLSRALCVWRCPLCASPHTRMALCVPLDSLG